MVSWLLIEVLLMSEAVCSAGQRNIGSAFILAVSTRVDSSSGCVSFVTSYVISLRAIFASFFNLGVMVLCSSMRSCLVYSTDCIPDSETGHFRSVARTISFMSNHFFNLNVIVRIKIFSWVTRTVRVVWKALSLCAYGGSFIARYLFTSSGIFDWCSCHAYFIPPFLAKRIGTRGLVGGSCHMPFRLGSRSAGLFRIFRLFRVVLGLERARVRI